MSKKILVLITIILLLLVTVIPAFAANYSRYTAYGKIGHIDYTLEEFIITVTDGNIISKGVYGELSIYADLKVEVVDHTVYFECGDPEAEISFADLELGDTVRIAGSYDGYTFTATSVTLK